MAAQYYALTLSPLSGYFRSGLMRMRTQFTGRSGRGVYSLRAAEITVAPGDVISVADARAQIAIERMTDDAGVPMWTAVPAQPVDRDYEAVLEANRDSLIASPGEPGGRRP